MRYCHPSFISINNLFKGTVLGLKLVRKFSLTRQLKSEQNCYLLIVGGGAGGCSVAAKFVRKLGKNKVTVIEPGDEHYYQPLFTLVGGGIKSVKESVRPMSEVLPAGATWVQDSVEQFYPDNNSVVTREGSAINYEFMVIACGLILNYRNVNGLYDALCMEDSGVCSNYTPEFAEKTYKTIKNLKSGKAVFNFPSGPVKCAGAPLKACFISEHYSRLHNTRCNIEFYYKTSLPVIFAVKHYESALMDVCERRNIKVDFQQELVAIKPDKKEAIFRLLDKTFELETIKYSMLHVTPPMCTPPELRSARTLTDKHGYLDVDKHTLQHVTYKNIFGLGDCTNLPTSKTAAAAGTQASILYHNLSLVMDDKPIRYCYNGYSSCPLVTEYGKCILAEFDYDHNPIETFPFDQRKERSIAYYVKRDVLPQIYWELGMKGYWSGPSLIRKLAHFGMDGIKIG